MGFISTLENVGVIVKTALIRNLHIKTTVLVHRIIITNKLCFLGNQLLLSPANPRNLVGPNLVESHLLILFSDKKRENKHKTGKGSLFHSHLKAKSRNIYAISISYRLSFLCIKPNYLKGSRFPLEINSSSTLLLNCLPL